MDLRRLSRGRIKWLWMPGVIALGALFMGSSCGDEPGPAYPIPDTTLRLIPEVNAIGDEGGPVFVIVELRASASEGEHVILYVRADGADTEALPGPVLCEKTSDATDGGTSNADSGTEDGGNATATTNDSHADITLPDIAILTQEAKDGGTGISAGYRQSGFLVKIPHGDGTVQLVATAYSHKADVAECKPTEKHLIAIASARIERTKPATPDAGTGTGGQGGSSTSSASSTSSGNGGAGGSNASGGAGGSNASGGAGGTGNVDVDGGGADGSDGG